MSESGLPHREQRQSKRFDARIKVKFRSGNEFADCYSRNISRGGIFIETAVLPDPNAHIELVLDLSESTDSDPSLEVTLTGRVVRLMTVTENNRSIHHVAIQFIQIPPKVQIALNRYYQKLAAAKS